VLSGFNAVQRFNPNPSPTREFRLRPPDSLAVGDDVAAQDGPHRGHGRSIAGCIGSRQRGQSPVFGLRNDHKAFAVQHERLYVG